MFPHSPLISLAFSKCAWFRKLTAVQKNIAKHLTVITFTVWFPQTFRKPQRILGATFFSHDRTKYRPSIHSNQKKKNNTFIFTPKYFFCFYSIFLLKFARNRFFSFSLVISITLLLYMTSIAEKQSLTRMCNYNNKDIEKLTYLGISNGNIFPKFYRYFQYYFIAY